MNPIDDLSRRTLLTGFAAFAMPAMPAAAASHSGGVRFGVRTPLPKTGLHERALLVKDLGYDGIELGPEWLDQPLDTLREAIRGTGVVVSAIVGSLQLLNPDPKLRSQAIELDRSRLRMAKDLGADCVIEVPVFGANRFTDISPVMSQREVEDQLLVAGLKQLAASAAENEVTLLLEPLTRKETHYMNLQEHGADILERAGSPRMGLLSDFYHMQMEEKDIPATLARYGKYTRYVHLADGAKRTEPGSLPFDYRPSFHELKKWNYSGWLTVESGATDEAESALQRALRYLKQQWAEA
jgi:sugar phosphate isomerase/epimerase